MRTKLRAQRRQDFLSGRGREVKAGPFHQQRKRLVEVRRIDAKVELHLVAAQVQEEGVQRSPGQRDVKGGEEAPVGE